MKLTGTARSQTAIAADETFRIDTNMAVLSLGFKGVPVPGLPFNDKLGILYNRNGRLYDPETDAITHGLYAVGWIRKGPSGIIGSNIPDATETVENILEDIANNHIPSSTPKRFDPTSLKEKNVTYVDWLGWNQLDKYELDAGKKLGKVREKVQELNRILEIAKH